MHANTRRAAADACEVLPPHGSGTCTGVVQEGLLGAREKNSKLL